MPALPGGGFAISITRQTGRHQMVSTAHDKRKPVPAAGAISNRRLLRLQTPTY